MSHDDLNRWCVDLVVGLARDRSLRLDHTYARGGNADVSAEEASADGSNVDEGDVAGNGDGVCDDCGVGGGDGGCDNDGPTAVQVVARAGDVVLMHPLVIHGGTTNHSLRPRLMANGMARVKREVFDSTGHPLFPKATIGDGGMPA